mmetsp:Transcript_55909/g.130635  ORF Transcript_55909/g.130635 Transcript_55909/m.130635 type:complete len:335 (+) Transcript_55909:99-1103(+)
MRSSGVAREGLLLVIIWCTSGSLPSAAFARLPAGSVSGDGQRERQLVSELKEAGRDGNWFKAERLLSKYTGCAAAVFTAALAVAYRCGRYQEGAQIHDRFRVEHAPADAAFQTEAIKIFTKLHAFGRVRQLWDEALLTQTVSASLLSARLAAAAAEGDLDGAEAVLQEMYSVGITPDVTHFNAAILACENSDKFTPAAMFLFEAMLAQGVMPNITTLTTLTACYSAAPLTDVLSIGARVEAFGLRADSAFAEAYTCAILGLRRNKRTYGRSWSTLAQTLENLSTERKAAARRAISHLRANGVKLPRSCQIVAAKLFFPGAALKVSTKTWPKAGG